MPRLFAAIDLPDEREVLLEQLRDDGLEARWIPSDQYHLTLRFIGDVEESTLEELLEALQEVEAAAFDLSGEGLDVFPSRRRPRVLVCRIDATPPLFALQARVDRVVVGLGVSRETKPFNPHVTFARLKGARPRDVRSYVKRHDDFRIEPFQVRKFHLYRSDLGSTGADHTVLRSYDLKDALWNEKDASDRT